MAITYIGSANATGNNPTSGNFSLPAGWQAGDVAIFWWFTYAYNKTFVKSGTGTGITTKRDINSSNYGHLFIGYRVLQTGDSTFAWTSSSVTNSTTIYGTSVFRGVSTTGDPFEAESGAPVTFTGVNNPDPPAVTTLTAGACVLPLFGKTDNYTSITPPSNYSTAGSNSSTAGSDASAGVAYRIIANPGSEDPGAWTLGSGGGTNNGYVWTGALKAALTQVFRKLQYSTEPPTTSAFNKLKYVSEPPVPAAWNKLAYEGE